MINTHHDDKVLYAGINDQIVYNEVKTTAAGFGDKQLISLEIMMNI